MWRAGKDQWLRPSGGSNRGSHCAIQFGAWILSAEVMVLECFPKTQNWLAWISPPTPSIHQPPWQETFHPCPSSSERSPCSWFRFQWLWVAAFSRCGKETLGYLTIVNLKIHKKDIKGPKLIGQLKAIMLRRSAHWYNVLVVWPGPFIFRWAPTGGVIVMPPLRRCLCPLLQWPAIQLDSRENGGGNWPSPFGGLCLMNLHHSIRVPSPSNDWAKAAVRGRG